MLGTLSISVFCSFVCLFCFLFLFLQQWEWTYGRIPDKAIVLMNSGWGSRWPDPRKVFNTDDPTDRTTFSFPSIQTKAAEFLVTRRHVIAIGVDSPAVEEPGTSTFPIHQLLAKNDALAVEFLANVQYLPPSGALVVIGMLKLRNGTGPPARVIGLVDDSGLLLPQPVEEEGWLEPLPSSVGGFR